ncbi:hypothetical protein QQX98_007096 [Neonectria punicea]|uniref:LYC1 C-terminal domain-containing protein n=1 Tax=Neonectria punicea TaxID=979145 RepID=A0ABR1GZL2_9HYPO
MSLPPDFDPDTLILREATEVEKIQSWRNNSVAWKGKLSVSDYIGQQACNGDQDLTRNGRIRYWIYTDGTEVYTSAETLQKAVVVRAADDQVRTEWSYGVAGVFTRVRFRRRGCASSMMRKLAAWLDSDEAPCQFTVLWSAVGNFYEQFGWSTFPTVEVMIPLAAAPARSLANAIDRDQVRLLCEVDVQAVTSNIKRIPKQPPEEVCAAFLPTYAQASWHFASEEYVASKLFKNPDRMPTSKGARSNDERVWCYWLHDFNADKLIILRLAFNEQIDTEDAKKSDLDGVAQVLRAARAEAASWGLKKVSIWNPDKRVISACKEILRLKPDIREEIQGNIPCLRWKHGRWGSHVRSRVRWEFREMYPWC